MRRVFVVALLLFGVTSLASAAQRGGGVAASGMRAMPAAPMGGVHAAAPMGGVHAAPRAGVRMAQMRGAPQMHSAVPVHPGVHGAAPGARPTTSHKPAGHPVFPQPPISPSPGNHGVSFVPNPFTPGFPFLPGANDFFASTYPAPGLGFDYAHFFAIHPNWGRFHPVDGVVLPFFGGGGFYMPVPYYTPSTPQEEEEERQQANTNQQPVSNQQATAEEPAAPSRTRSGSYMSSEPVPEFVFVKHDGSMFSAVAYSWTKDKLQYVTKEGLRRTTGIDTLDLAATERMNEERGNTVNLPKPLASSVALSIEPAPLR
jgi:hypothetical protein